MMQHASSALPLKGTPTINGWDVVEVRSDSNPAKKYRVDITFGRCDCPAWKFARAGADGRKNPCKHLQSLGFVRLVDLASQPVKPKQKMTEVEYDQCL